MSAEPRTRFDWNQPRTRAVGSFVFIVLLGVVVYWFSQPRPGYPYKATALLMVSANYPKILFNTSEPKQDLASFQRQTLAVIKGRMVMNAALSDPKLVELKIGEGESDPVAWLASRLKTSFVGEILEIRMEGEEKAVLPIVVNAVASAYLKEVVNVEANNRQRRMEDLKRIWGKYQEDIKLKRESLRKLAMSAGSDDKDTLTLMKQYQIEQQGQIKREMLSTGSEIRKLKAEIAVLSRRKDVPDSRMEALKEKVEVLSQLEKSLRDEWDGSKEVATDLTIKTLDLSQMTEEIRLAEETAWAIGSEIEVLKVELQAPSRARWLEQAVEQKRPLLTTWLFR